MRGTYININSGDREDHHNGLFIGCVPIKFLNPPVPLDGVKRHTFQVVGTFKCAILRFLDDSRF